MKSNTTDAVAKESVAKVVEVLNKARSMELHALSQYMNQHYNLDNLDYGEFAVNIKRIAIDEMRHAELFAERIKELDHEPTSDMGIPVQKGQELETIFPSDVALEEKTMEVYNEFLAICRENNDIVSCTLFRRILGEEQKHYDHFTNVHKHIASLGKHYLAKIAGTPSDIGETTLGFIKPF